MKALLIIIIALFLYSCEEESVQPEAFVDTISYRVINIVNNDTYYVNDPETGIDNIVLLNYYFFTDSNQLYYRNPVPNKKNPSNFYTTGIFHDSEYPTWNRLIMKNLILYSEDYKKIEFSLDRMDDLEANKYEDSLRYKYVKSPQRFSLVVTGYYRKNGQLRNYTLNSVYEGKIGALIDEDSRFWYNTNRNLSIEMSAESFFTVDGKVIEPIQSNMEILEKNFHKCMTATVK